MFLPQKLKSDLYDASSSADVKKAPTYEIIELVNSELSKETTTVFVPSGQGLFIYVRRVKYPT